MVLMDSKRQNLTLKVVYVGPRGAGKKTSLSAIAHRFRGSVFRERMGSTTRTVLDLPPTCFGFGPNFQPGLRLECYPRMPLFERDSRECFQSLDGLIFVADSQLRCLEENRRSLGDLNRALGKRGKTLEKIPHVFQWNKCEMPDAILPQDLNRRLNAHQVPNLTTTAFLDLNVFESLHLLSDQMIRRLGMNLCSGRYETSRLRKAAPGRKRWPMDK